MRVNGVPMRTIWPEPRAAVGIIDQTRLPHALLKLSLRSPQDVAEAIRIASLHPSANMGEDCPAPPAHAQVAGRRGAPLPCPSRRYRWLV